VAKPPASRKHSRNASQQSRPGGLWGKDTLLIERMSQEGRGVASRSGKIVFVSGALSGEQVQAQCRAVKRDYDEADMIELVKETAPAAQRVPPPCPVYQRCGGCSLQHWSLAAQQQHQQASLLAMLQSVVPALTLDPPVTSEPIAFRHRLRLLVARNADRSYVLGLRQRQSHAVESLQHCLIANAAVNTLLQALPGMLLSAPDLQGLREIEIDADSNNQLGLCFYFAAPPGEKVLYALRVAVLTEPVVALRVRLIAHRTSHSEAHYDEPGREDSAQSRELHAEGELCLKLEVPAAHDRVAMRALKLAYLPGDFTQTNWAVNTALLVRALDWLRPHNDEHAIDLFAGIGNFSLPLAHYVKSVLALEGNSTMVERILANAKHNGLGNISAKALNLLAGDMVLPKADLAIVDPPRAGAKTVCEVLARSRVKRLVYVSCHPATLLRDARVLHSGGLHLTRAATVAMFPHTGHSEAIALFARK
jgi:23S rRNA (uracil1939-C5)-methyltransferase